MKVMAKRRWKNPKVIEHEVQDVVEGHHICPSCAAMLPHYARWCGNCAHNLLADTDPSKQKVADEAKANYDECAEATARKWGFWYEGYKAPRPWWWHYRGGRSKEADEKRKLKNYVKRAKKKGYLSYTDRFDRDEQFRKRMIGEGRTRTL